MPKAICLPQRLRTHNERIRPEFEIALDGSALAWLDEHKSADALVIAYEETRC